MFTLRTILKSGVQINQVIGNYYETVLKDFAKEDFDRIYKEQTILSNNLIPDDCYGFLLFTDACFFLSESCYYYIVNENGATFEKIKSV